MAVSTFAAQKGAPLRKGTPSGRLGPRVGAAIGRPPKTEGTAYQTAERMGKTAEALCASLYESLVNEIHQNGSDAPYWLAVPHEGPVPTPEEILLFLYREYHRQLNDPLFYPACYQL